MENHSTLQIRQTIKRLLKKQNAQYSDLAKILNLTIPAVKRLMTKGDFTISRIERIANWFGLTLNEFFQIVKEAKVEPSQLSLKQEKALAERPLAFYILLLLGAGLPFSEIERRSKVSQSELRKQLLFLDKVDLIELGSENRVRLLSRGPYRWIANGPLQKKWIQAYIHQLRNLVAIEPQEGSLQIPFELYLSGETAQKMQTDLQAVFEKYRSLSRIDHEVSSPEHLRAYTGLVLLRCFDGWGRLLIQPH